MTHQCPDCGITYEGDPKFCPGCGAALRFDERSPYAPEDKKTTVTPDPVQLIDHTEDTDKEQRMFILRKRTYGDTAEYSDDQGYHDKEVEKQDDAKKLSLSLYLSVIAIVLSLTAIAMVIIFAILPSNKRADVTDPAASSQPAETRAPTQPPTEPPIVGNYTLAEIKGEDVGISVSMLKTGVLKLYSDYTGVLKVDRFELGDVMLEKGSRHAVFLDTECEYTFDGSKILTFEYKGVTLVYKKEL